MFLIEVGADDIISSRFAVSPITQAVAALHALSGRLPPGSAGPWIKRARPRYLALRKENPHLAALAFMLRSRGYNPDFIAPPPQAGATDIEADLAAVRATPVERARHEIGQALLGRGSPPPSFLRMMESPDLVPSLAGALEALWSELIAADWSAIRVILERDIARRAGSLAAYGLDRALADMSPDIRCRAHRARVDIEVLGMAPGKRALDGRGILFLPNAFSAMWLCLDKPWRAALTYPATGTAQLFCAPPGTPSADDALSNLVGRSRARLLRSLIEPATTTQLGALLGMGLGNVGDQIGVLRRSGLVQGRRVGRGVVYGLTGLGEDLVNAPR